MKPPPVLLGLIFLLRFGCVKTFSCSSFPKSNILFNEATSFNTFKGNKITAKYLNHIDEKYTLSCFNQPRPGAVLRTVDGKHVVTIFDLPCQSRKSLIERTFMFLKRPKPTSTYLVLGVLPQNSQEWCVYDLNLSKNKADVATDSTATTNPLWNWSEPGGQVYAYQMKDYSIDRTRIAADYVNNGNIKFVLHCFKDKTAIIRNPIGQRISIILNFDCENEENFIQTFFVHTLITENGKTTGTVYRLNDPQAKSVNLPWYDGEAVPKQGWGFGGRPENDKYNIWFYPFISTGNDGNCYWNKINVAEPNTCPSMPYNSIIQDITKSRKETEQLFAVAKYSNLDNPKIKLTCFKSNMDTDKSLSVLTYSTAENHIATVKNMDCSTSANLENLFFVRYTYGESDLNYITIGKRDSITDEWCSYSFHKTSSYTWQFNYFVYYTFKPTESVASWKETQKLTSPDQCSVFEGKIIAGNYKSGNYESSPSQRYLWVNKAKSEMYLLLCYTHDDPQTGSKIVIAHIKNFNNEVLVSTVGLGCPNTEDKYFLSLRIIGRNKYISIGVRSNPDEDWCRYDMCLDCKDKTVRYSLDSTRRGEEIYWSKSGVQWKQELKTDYENKKAEPVQKVFTSSGKTSFVIACVNSQTYKHIVISASGSHTAKADLNFDCKTTNSLQLIMFFVTENSYGDLNIYTALDCKNGCDMVVGDKFKESWLFYYDKEIYYSQKNIFQSMFYFSNVVAEPSQSCTNLNMNNIKFNEPYKDKSGQGLVEYQTGIDFKFKMFCYQQGDIFHADIKYMDKYLLTIDNYNCMDRISVYNKLMVTKPKHEDGMSVAVLGSREVTGRYCCYNILKLPDTGQYVIKMYHRFPVKDIDLQWYEGNPKDCPLIKKKNIKIVSDSQEDFGILKKIYVGKTLLSEYVMIRCYEQSASDMKYTFVISRLYKEGEDNIEVVFKEVDCTDINFLKKIFLFSWESAGKSFITLGSLTVDKLDPKREYQQDSWCRYDMYLDRESPQVYVNILSRPFGQRMYQWFEAGIVQLESRPSLKNKFQVKNEMGIIIRESSLIKTIYSYLFSVTFVIRCYEESKNKYLLVITSPDGLHFGTIKGYDCSYAFDDLHLHIEKGGKIIYSGGLFYSAPKPGKEVLCWYYGCNTPNDPSEKITIFYFFSKKFSYPSCNQNNLNKNPYLITIPGWCERTVVSSARGPDVTCSITNTLQLNWEHIKTTEISEVQQLPMIYKYVRLESPRLQLHCYIKEKDGWYLYYFVITSQDGKPIFMIAGHDCSPLKGQPRHEIFVDVEAEELNEEYNLFFVGNNKCWFSVEFGQTCETKVINMLTEHILHDGFKWKQVPIDECPQLKPDDIYKDENKIPLTDDKLVARYMNKEAKGILYDLFCYEVAGQGGAVDYVSAIKSVDRAHSVFVKGLQCSTKAKLEKSTFIGTRQVEGKQVLIIGSRIFAEKSTAPWCLYEVCLSCDSPQATPTAITEDEDLFEWSENGIKIDNCPSPNREKVWNEVGKSTVAAEYEHIFGQDCCMINDNSWFLMLKTRKGMYIKAIPVEGKCNDRSQENLVRHFHVHVASKKEVFTSTSTVAIDDAVNLCWNTREQIAQSDTWLYYFRREPWSKLHEEIKHKDECCRFIPKETITADTAVNDGTSDDAIHEFWNGGNAGVKIKIHVKHADNSVNVLISNSVNSVVFKIANVNFLKDKIEKLDQVLYIEYEKVFLVIGSRGRDDDPWCWYIIYHTDNQIDQVVVTKDYMPKIGASQWYKADDKECELVKRNQILTKENTEITKEKEPLLIVIGTVEKSSNLIGEIFYNTFYITKDAENHNDKRCLMVIRSENGQHLATVQDHQCPPGSTNYMFRYSENPDNLIFGVTNKDEQGEIVSNCQYDICLNCNENAIRLNSHFLTKDEAKAFVWSELPYKSEKAPSLKNQGVNIDDLLITRTRINKKMPLFVVECLKKGKESNYEQTAVVRTYTGLILAKIPNVECEENNLEIELKYILTMKKDGTFIVHDLGITEPPEKGKESSWFYGCDESEVSEIKDKRIFYKAERVTGNNRIPAWKEVSIPTIVCPIVDSSETILTELNEGKVPLLAEFTNAMNFKLECYVNGNLFSKESYTSIIRDPEGKHITNILNVDCVSVQKLQTTIGVSRMDNENGLNLFSINLTPDNECEYCSKIVCTNCEQEKQWLVYSKEIVNTGSDWVKSSPKACYSLDRKDIVVNQGEIDLNGYEVKEIYINEEDDEENMFILTCYQKSESEFYARVRLLNGQLVAYIKNIQCVFKNELLSYMFLMKSGENKYLALGTRIMKDNDILPWCRYDICLDCGNTDDKVRVNLDDDPANLPQVKWSTNWFQGSTDKDGVSSSGAPKSAFKSSEYPEYNLNCYDSSNTGDKLSVINRGDTPLITVSSSQCFGDIDLLRTFYIYSLSKDSKYSLIRHGPVKQGEPIQEANVDQKVLFSFHHDKAPDARLWRQKLNPVVNVKDTSGLPPQEEVDKCLPKQKSFNELLCNADFLSAVNTHAKAQTSGGGGWFRSKSKGG